VKTILPEVYAMLGPIIFITNNIFKCFIR